VPGLLMKGGAEGVCAFALPDGRACAVKFDDGAARATPPLMATLLLALIAGGTGRPAGAGRAGLGLGEPGHVEPDLAVLGHLASAPVTGAGEPVGEVRPVAGLRDLS
jgi:hypothetical protein